MSIFTKVGRFLWRRGKSTIKQRLESRAFAETVARSVQAELKEAGVEIPLGAITTVLAAGFGEAARRL